MIPRLPVAPLQRAIDERLCLEQLCPSRFELLAGMRVADYVGDYRLRPSAYGEHDPMQASAQAFFEDDGVYLERLDGKDHDRPYAVVLFGTFLVIEFNAFTPQAHFLVLAPCREADPAAPYRGLWDAQRIERLRSALQAPDAVPRLFEELDRLLAALRPPPSPRRHAPRPRRWLARLLGRR